MSLNIKNPRVHQLAREAAQRTGLTQTGAIELALERLLTEVAQETSAIDMLVVGMQADVAQLGCVSTDALYDESGLPR